MSDRERSTILSDRLDDGSIAVITLNRPEKLNATPFKMHFAFDEALRQADEDEKVGCIVVTGAGRAFSTGLDMNELSTYGPDQFVVKMLERQEPYYHWANLKTPSIAVVNGPAHGSGVILATCLDIRIGSENAEFRFTGCSGGTAMCTYILPHVVGWPKAKELIFTTRAVGADEALSIGLLNQLVPSENLMEAALEMARMIAVHPRVGESEAKRLMQATANRSLRESFVDECMSLVTTMRSALSQNNIHLHHFHEDADLTAFGVSRSPE